MSTGIHLRDLRSGHGDALLALLALIAALARTAFLPAEAGASISLCVEVDTVEGDMESFRKLVLSEVARHPSHVAVEQGCESVLIVELIEVAGSRTLTARVNLEVPVRFQVKTPQDLEENLVDAITQVLGSDPVWLVQDVTKYSAIQKAAHAVTKKGSNKWRIELYETIGRSRIDPAFAPGGAFAFSRGSGHWYVLVRLYFAGMPGRMPHSEQYMRIHTGADVGFAFEVSALALSTFYLGAGIGLQYLRYEGYVTVQGREAPSYVNEVGVVASCRLGVRFLRVNDFDLDVFAMGYLPFFVTRQTDVPLFGAKGLYTPSIQIGVGVGF